MTNGFNASGGPSPSQAAKYMEHQRQKLQEENERRTAARDAAFNQPQPQPQVLQVPTHVYKRTTFHAVNPSQVQGVTFVIVCAKARRVPMKRTPAVSS